MIDWYVVCLPCPHHHHHKKNCEKRSEIISNGLTLSYEKQFQKSTKNLGQYLLKDDASAEKCNTVDAAEIFDGI